MRIQIVAFLILISCLNVFSKANAQKVTLQLKQVELETVFKAIEKQTDYSFAYGVSLLQNSKPVTVQLDNVGLTEALDRIFANLPYRYEIVNKTILIKAKPEGAKQPTPEKAKPIRITGKVTDINNTPLPAVSIRVRGTNLGTVTDQNGYYSIEAEPDAILVFSSVGFQTMEIKINGQSEINMTMVGNASQLRETEIKGYYNTTKELTTGSVTIVKAEDIAKAPISDPLAALQGRVAGLSIQSTSGVPGRAFNVTLRGRNSVQTVPGGAVQNYPLYIVDGVPFNAIPLNTTQFLGGGGQAYSPLNDLNPNDIETIEILKDADGTSIYGSLGANGVIIINTKRGKAGRTSLDVNFYQGAGNISYYPKLLNTKEYIAMRELAFKNDGVTPIATDYDVNGTWDKNVNRDWTKMMIGNTASITDVQVSVSGGNQGTQFRFGGFYRKEGTVFPGDFTNKKRGASFNLSHVGLNGRFNANLSSSLAGNNSNLPAEDMALYVLLAPNAPVPYNADGTLNWANNTWANPFAILERDNEEKTLNLISNLNLSFQLVKGLTIKAILGYNISRLEHSLTTPFSSFNPTFTNPDTRRSLRTANSNLSNWLAEPQVSYDGNFLRGKIAVLVGTSFQSREQSRLTITGTGYTSDEAIRSIIAAQTKTISEDVLTEYRYNAIYGKFTYNLKDRYIINLTARRDGSSRFGPGRQFGNFGAIGGAWIFSKEEFVKNKFPFISFGKLRGSLGTAGNDRLEDYRFLSTYSAYTANYQDNNSLQPTQHTNPFFGWEKVKKFEAAIELGFLNERIHFLANLYRNHCGNQLVGYSLPMVTGFNNIQANLPALVENKGIEIEISTVNLIKNSFRWSTNLNITIPRNKLISYPNIEASSYASRYQVGLPLSVLYRYKYLGVDRESGLYQFEDKNSDGTITSASDRTFFSTEQKLYGGLSNTLIYKNLKLDVLLYFVVQRDINYLTNNLPGSFQGGMGNQPQSILNADYILPYSQISGEKSNSQSLFRTSDGWIRDASFMQIKNISLSWQLPKSWTSKKIIRDGRIFAQCQNLLTFSKYKGYNPEYPQTIPLLPPLRIISAGVQIQL